MAVFNKRITLLIIPFFILGLYFSSKYLDAEKIYFPFTKTSTPGNWADEYLTEKQEIASKSAVLQKCDFATLKMPIRVQEVKGGTGVLYKMFLHPPFIDVHISDPQWNNGVPGSLVFENALHPDFLESMNRIKKIKNSQDLTIVDIGGNIGVHTLFFATQGARVHTFEPSKANFMLLECSTYINNFKNVVLNNIALSNETTGGDGWCIVTPHNFNQGHKVLTKDCGGGLFPSLGDDQADNSAGIRTIPMDDYWTRVLGKSRVDLIKIDIEGHEPLAFAGAHQMLTENPPYVIYSEFQPVVSKEMGWDPVEFIQRMWGYGYTMELSLVDLGFRTRKIDSLEVAKELVAFVEVLTAQHKSMMLLDLVFKHRDFLKL